MLSVRRAHDPLGFRAITPEAKLGGAGDDASTILQAIALRHCHGDGEHYKQVEAYPSLYLRPSPHAQLIKDQVLLETAIDPLYCRPQLVQALPLLGLTRNRNIASRIIRYIELDYQPVIRCATREIPLCSLRQQNRPDFSGQRYFR